MNENRALTIPAGGKLAPIMPTSFEDVQRFANVAVKAGFFKGNQETALALATLAIMQGMELGIQPMQSIQQIAVINGRCQVWGDLIPGLIWSHGHEIDERLEGEGDETVAYCKITRGDNGKVIERLFSVKQAKVAGLWKKAGPWTQYPDRMLQMRARGFCARDAIPDVLRGMAIREEMQDVPEPRDITPQPPMPPAPPEPPAPPAIESQEPAPFDLEGFKARLSEDLAMANDYDSLGDNWAQHEATMEDNLSRDEREDLLGIYRKHEQRIRGVVPDEEASRVFA